MLVAIGFDPVKAAVMALVADTAPVAFGALAVPITTLHFVTDQPYSTLGAMVGRQCPVIGFFVPFVLVFIVDGTRGLRATWPVALACGLAFALSQYFVSNFISPQLADVVAALVSAGAVVALTRVWSPASVMKVAKEGATSPSGRDTLLAYAPYIFVVIIFSLAQIPTVAHLLSYGVFKFQWPGLDLAQVDDSGAISKVNTGFTVNFLTVAGTLLLISGILTMVALQVRPAVALKIFGKSLVQVRWALATIFMILAVAFIMNWSGQTTTLGRFLAGAGPAYALISPVVGWVGVVVTGSDNSTNALFGHLQVVAAKATGISPVLLAAANTTGGVLGKMLSPQSIAIGAAAVGLIGREGDVFRSVFGWAVGMLAAFCVYVYLQSTPVLGWMVP
jgi:lactate permease